MPNDERVLAICVNWNGSEILPEAIQALLRSRHPPEVVVVDSGSTDGSTSLIPEGVEVLEMGQNRGYAAALNAGLRLGLDRGFDYFFLLNYDVVVEPDTLERLLGFARGRETAICGPKIVDHHRPDRLDAAWGSLIGHHVLAHFRGKGARDGPRWSRPRAVELLLGCALLVPRPVFKEVGLFDENYFMYHEEVDFLFRARQKGYAVFFCPFAKARHRGAYGTRDQPLLKVLWVRRNSVYFLRKHAFPFWRWGLYWSTLFASLAFNLLLLRWVRVRVIGQGVREGFRMSVETPQDGFARETEPL